MCLKPFWDIWYLLNNDWLSVCYECVMFVVSENKTKSLSHKLSGIVYFITKFCWRPFIVGRCCVCTRTMVQLWRSHELILWNFLSTSQRKVVKSLWVLQTVGHMRVLLCMFVLTARLQPSHGLATQDLQLKLTSMQSWLLMQLLTPALRFAWISPMSVLPSLIDKTRLVTSGTLSNISQPGAVM